MPDPLVSAPIQTISDSIALLRQAKNKTQKHTFWLEYLTLAMIQIDEENNT